MENITPVIPGKQGENDSDMLLVNVKELEDKLMFRKSDILMIETDPEDPKSRKKIVCIKGEEKSYTIKNITFMKLCSHCEKLIMVNKFTVISFDAVHWYRHDCITLKNIFKGWFNKQVTLNQKYREDFYEGLKRLYPNLSGDIYLTP